MQKCVVRAPSCREMLQRRDNLLGSAGKRPGTRIHNSIHNSMRLLPLATYGSIRKYIYAHVLIETEGKWGGGGWGGRMHVTHVRSLLGEHLNTGSSFRHPS